MWEKIKRFFGRETEPLTEQQKAIFNLQKLQKEHCFLDVRFPARNEEFYQSLILDVHLEKQTVLLDELYPKNLVPDFFVGDIVEVTSRRKGMRLRFTSSIVPGGLHEDSTFSIALPDVVHATQQRNHYRVNIGFDTGIKLFVYDDEEVVCSVVNLSNDGIGFSMLGNQVRDLEQRRMFIDCAIELPDHSTLACSIEFRAVELKKRPHEHTLIGGKISDIASGDQKKIDQYIAHLQRMQRQRELRTS